MGLNLDYEEGQTPLDEDEIEGLLIPSISMQSELDQFEQQNIEDAVLWAIQTKFNVQNISHETLICRVHKRMYNKVWAWAGKFRTTNKNIGVDYWLIATELKYLLDNLRFWMENNTYGSDEIAIRFKHRLVSIHCFANGNGRHSRLMADIIVEKIYKKDVFTWGFKTNIEKHKQRKNYILALQDADNGDFAPLLVFARS